MPLSADDTTGIDGTDTHAIVGYQERLTQTRDDLATCLPHAITTGDGWAVAERILARWAQLQAWEAVRRTDIGPWGTIDIREACRAEATRLMEEIRRQQERQELPPSPTE